MAVTSSTTVAAGTAPTSVDQLWALTALFAANWTNDVKIHQAFSTDITRSISDVEQRRALFRCPVRTIEVDLAVRGAANVSLFRSFLLRAGNARFLFPLYSDELVIASVSTYTLTCDAGSVALRRFQAGGRVAVVGWGPDRASVASLTVATITSVSADTITTDTSMAGTSGYSVFPLIEAEIILDQSNIQIQTDQMLTLTLSVMESRGPWSLDSMQAINTVPSGFSSFGGYPILSIAPNQVNTSFSFLRSGEFSTVGRGRITQVYGGRGRAAYSFQYDLFDRATAVQLIKFFESRGGRLLPFFLSSTLTDFQIVSIDSSTQITVKSSLLAVDWSFFKYLCIEDKSGVQQIVSITSVTASGGNWVIAISALTSTPTLTTLAKVSLAHLVRFDTDEMVEQWVTDKVLSTGSPLNFLEVVAEGSATISNIVDLSLGYPA